MDGWTDRQTDGPMKRRMEGQTHELSDIHADGQTEIRLSHWIKSSGFGDKSVHPFSPIKTISFAMFLVISDAIVEMVSNQFQ